MSTSSNCRHCQSWNAILLALGVEPAVIAAHSLKRSHMKHNVMIRRPRPLIHNGRK